MDEDQHLLVFWPSPLSRLHPASPLQATSPCEWPARERLYGTRGVYRPRISIRTLQKLGDVRHALAQRAIAGTLEVHARFAEELSDEAKKLIKK